MNHDSSHVWHPASIVPAEWEMQPQDKLTYEEYEQLKASFLAAQHEPMSVAKSPVYTVINPGDTVLIAFAVPITQEEAQQLKDRLSDVFPDAKFGIIDQVANVIIQPGP